MELYKTTTKEVKEHYDNIISVEYRAMPQLLPDSGAAACVTGVHGWNYDVFEGDNNNCVVSGFHCPEWNGIIRPNQDLIKRFNNKIRKEFSKNTSDYDELEKTRKELLNEFIETAILERKSQSHKMYKYEK